MKTDTVFSDFKKTRFRILRGLVKEFEPKELYICRVDNWFDSKWLNFSGKTLGAVALWKKEITIPPFHPNRITGEGIFDRQSDATEESCTYKLRKGAPYIHVEQASGENLNRKIKYISSDALFVWQSENTEHNACGCIMAYVIRDNEIVTFYASMQNTATQDEPDKWIFHKVAGISQAQLTNYVNKGKPFHLRFDVS